MRITAENLNTDGYEEFNLALITGGIVEYISDAIDREIESFCDYYAEITGKDVPDIDQITWNFPGYYEVMAKALPATLAWEFPELFKESGDATTAPITIKGITTTRSNDPAGWGREQIGAEIKIDGEALKHLADQHGVTEIHDGQGISGFVRTADDAYWSQIKTIEALIDQMYSDDALHWALIELAEDDVIRDNHMGFGTLMEDIARAEAV